MKAKTSQTIEFYNIYIGVRSNKIKFDLCLYKTFCWY